MKIYTRTGDKGQTSLLGGARILKSDPRIEAYGTLDELNSYLGLVRDQEVNAPRADFLKEVQDRIFTIGSHLASDPGKDKLKRVPDLFEADVQALEQGIDQMNEDLPPMRSFILPGGHQSVSFCHVARTVCRRAERRIIELDQEDEVEALIIQYINRLSDYLFVLGRKMAQELNAPDVPWKPRS